jgi:hypothetical protein
MRWRTSTVATRRGCAGTVGPRANLVVQTQCQRDSLARQVDLLSERADAVAQPRGMHMEVGALILQAPPGR